MARYDVKHKAATRERILERAGRRFKIDGIEGSGVATLMKDAGLTNGAFYGHFESKDDLVAATVADQLERQRAYLGTLAPGMVGVEQFVREYLSVEHRDDTAGGCLSGALVGDIARSAGAARQAYAEGLIAIADDIAGRIGVDAVGARSEILSAFGLMLGALQLSRAMSGTEISEEVLSQAVKAVLALLKPGAIGNAPGPE
jgi:TetR/AcrR family transcriptional repressor of nem operon